MRSNRRDVVTGATFMLAGLSSTAQGQTQRSSPSSSPVFLILYRPGPQWLTGKPLAEQPLREHGRYLLELFQRGVLREAGGFGDDSGGAAVIRAAGLTEARSYADADPSVASGIFTYEVCEWRLVDWAALAKRRG